MGRLWRSRLVEEMLAKVDSDAARPAGLAPEFGLQKKGGYRLSEAQAQRILEMQLQRLTGLEQDKIVSEYKEVMEKIVDLLDILAKPARITKIISGELADMKKQYGDERRSEIVEHTQDLSMEDLIASEDVVVTLSHGGYMKCQPVADYRAQKRGGRGKQATTTKEDDFVEKLFIANTHDYILCFSNRGRIYWLKVYSGSARQPQQPRQADRQPGAAARAREDHRSAAGQGIRRRALRIHGDRQRHGQENRVVGVFAAAPVGHHRRQPRRRRLPDRRRADRRQAGRHVVLRHGQSVAFRGGRSARDGPQCGRRARHEAGQRRARHFAAYCRRYKSIGVDRDRERLRQAHADRRLHPARPRHAGHDRDPRLRSATASWWRRRSSATTTKSC